MEPSVALQQAQDRTRSQASALRGAQAAAGKPRFERQSPHISGRPPSQETPRFGWLERHPLSASAANQQLRLPPHTSPTHGPTLAAESGRCNAARPALQYHRNDKPDATNARETRPSRRLVALPRNQAAASQSP